MSMRNFFIEILTQGESKIQNDENDEEWNFSLCIP